MVKFAKYISLIALLFAGSVWAFHMPLTENILKQDVQETFLSASDSVAPFPTPKPNPDGSLPETKGLQGKKPSNFTTTINYDPENNEYKFVDKVGNIPQSQRTMSFDEYVEHEKNKSMHDYWVSRSADAKQSPLNDLIPDFSAKDIKGQLFGSDFISIKAQGSAEIIMGFIANKREDPSLNIDNQKTFNFDFQTKFQFNLTAKIGNQLEFKINHNTEALFAFENKLKLQYEGKEDDIIKFLQLGNVDFPLNTTLIQGSQNLFGAKAQLQFGKTFVTAVVSEQRGETKSLTVQGGAETKEFNIKADEYETNRHFFVAHYFRDNYNGALSSLPIINSNVNIVKMEVWVTNIGSPVTNNRNLIALTDLGESNPSDPGLQPTSSNPYPSNNSNNLLQKINVNALRNINSGGNYLVATMGYTPGKEFEKIESARKLMDNEYTYNTRLGFISLRTPLNADQVLAVAFQYQVIGDSTVYQVGELSDQGINDPSALVVKLIKSSNLNTKGPLWDLMMKNVYSLEAYQISAQDFRLNVLYAGDALGVPSGYFQSGPKSGIPLIRLMGMDQLDFQQNRNPDGVFDFIDRAAQTGGLIESETGRIYLPLVEPFGKDLITIFDGDQNAANKYMFDELYRYTKTEAQQYPDKNKYYIAGTFKSAAGSDIYLGAMNIPQGSVRVTAGNIPLVEDVDYIVDYNMGRVKIINEGIISSGAPLNISTENNAMFNVMTKRMLGLRVEHRFNPKFYVGGTFMNLHQNPLTEKVPFGEEPINNSIWGVDFGYESESRVLTKMVDRILPFTSTTVPSRINVYGEFAQFIPGHARVIGKEGVTYIDDFEGSKSTFNLRDNYSWFLASTPQWQTDLFPEASKSIVDEKTVEIGYNRARLAWYIIDRMFYDRSKPSNITKDDQSDPYARNVEVEEVFPNRNLGFREMPSQVVFNLAYYPQERGPYNYETSGISGISKGLDVNGFLNQPETRWAGIMRKIDNTDFEANNIENIEFWMMDPFIGKDGQNGNPMHSGGTLYFNLGDVSEDVLRDGRKSFENGLYNGEDPVVLDTTPWGLVPHIQAIVRAFDNTPSKRLYQDVGLDGLSSEQEASFFDTYLQQIKTMYGENSDVYQNILKDPSNDDYHYFFGSDYDQENKKITERYKRYNDMEGNSRPPEYSQEDYPTQQTNYPNNEDINGDNTLNEAENYFQYTIPLHPDQMQVGQNYITDIQTSTVSLENGDKTTVRWYQFKVPIRSPEKVVGQIQGFQSIRFMRMFLKDFSEEVILRFATLELVKSDWRKYLGDLLEEGAYGSGTSSDDIQFDVATVNIEENAYRQPVNYVLPPGIQRVTDITDQNQRQMNEQSLSMRILNLSDGDARAVYKTANLDMRQFGYLKMFVHAEKAFENQDIDKGDLTLFIRVGADFDENYYEYEMPLNFTPWGDNQPDQVWPQANDVEIDLAELVKVKEERNAAIRNNDPSVNYTQPYVKIIGDRRVTVIGTPTISAVKTIMIGVRNPKKKILSDMDNGKAQSAEVWINELCLTDFSKKSGYAATLRTQATLGDLGNVNLSGSYVSDNFGSLEQKISDLTKDNTISTDASANIELGKFLPPQTGIRLPVHYDISQTVANPEYNPLDADVKTADDLKTYQSEAEKEAVEKQIQDYTLRQNINFMNVRKDRMDNEKKQRFYDLENFNLSYSYSSVEHRNEDLEYDNTYIHRGGLGYLYTLDPKNVQPFAKTKALQKKSLALIKDINFYYLPKSFSFNTEIGREFNENKLRNKMTWADILIDPTYYKRFDWMRNYALKYDLTKAITFDYNATADAYIKEPPGKINTEAAKKEVWESIGEFGKLRNFNQNVSANWAIPIQKIPLLTWTTASMNYRGEYRWEGAAPALDSIGNTVSNGNTQTYQINGDLVKLYNMVPFLRKINQASPKKTTTPRKPATPKETEEEKNKKEEKNNEAWTNLSNGMIRLLMGVRRVSFSYTLGAATIAPGFMPTPTILGDNLDMNAPGIPFVFGAQKDLRELSVRAGNDWFSRHPMQNNQYVTNQSKNLTYNVTFEPFRDFNVQFNAFETEMKRHNEYYKWDEEQDSYISFSPQSGGSYSISIWALNTIFTKERTNHTSPVFDEFLNNRIFIAERLSSGNPNSADVPFVYDTNSNQYFPYGYGPTSQEVLIPSFFAAYTGKDVNKVGLSPFLNKFPIPGWNLTYNGLSKIKWVKQYFNRVTLQNAYKATYSIASYTTNLLLTPEDAQNPLYQTDLSGNFISPYQIDAVVISDQFVPLIKLGLELKNNFQTNFEIKKTRSIALSFVNQQVTEQLSNEFVFGIGYRFKDVNFRVNSGGNRTQLSSDLNVRGDLSIRSNKTTLRRIDQDVNIPSAGSNVITLNLQADYQLFKNLVLRLYFDRVVNKPYVMNTVNTATTSGGISLRMTFNQ